MAKAKKFDAVGFITHLLGLTAGNIGAKMLDRIAPIQNPMLLNGAKIAIGGIVAYFGGKNTVVQSVAAGIGVQGAYGLAIEAKLVPKIAGIGELDEYQGAVYGIGMAYDDQSVIGQQEGQVIGQQDTDSVIGSVSEEEVFVSEEDQF